MPGRPTHLQDYRRGGNNYILQNTSAITRNVINQLRDVFNDQFNLVIWFNTPDDIDNNYYVIPYSGSGVQDLLREDNMLHGDIVWSVPMNEYPDDGIYHALNEGIFSISGEAMDVSMYRAGMETESHVHQW